jgi:hypothetical protein
MSERQASLFETSECDHRHTIVVPERRGPHHAKLVCSDCRRFLKWIPSPENIRQQQENEKILTALAKLNLPEWERKFVRDLVTHKRLSPKQQKKLLELRDLLLKGDSAHVHDSFDGATLPPN